MSKTFKFKKITGKSSTLKRKKLDAIKLLHQDVGFRSFEDEYEELPQFKDFSFEQNIHTIQKLGDLINPKFAPDEYSPQDNFYKYINYSWDKSMKNKYKKEYFVQLDDFRLVQKKVYQQVMELVKNFIQTNSSELAKDVRNVYKSMLTLNESSAQKHVDHSVQVIDEMIAEGNLWKWLAYMNSNEMISWSCPISWSVKPDNNNSSIFHFNITPGQVSLFDFTVYFDSDDAAVNKYKNNVLDNYYKFINLLFDTCLGKNHGLKAKDVFEIEKRIIAMYSCDKIKNDSPEFYNLIGPKEALSKCGFDWEEFSKHLGIKTVPPKFIVGSLNYLSCCCEELSKNWTSPEWRTFWIYLYLKQIIRFHKKWKLMYFDFFQSFLQGQSVPFPDDLYPIFGLSPCFNTFLTEQYVSHFKNDDVISYVNNLAYDLKKVFVRKIKRNTWLSPPTKKAALKKIKYMKLLIAHPEELVEDPLLEYDPSDAWGNMKKICAARHSQFIKMDREKVFSYPTYDWNAFKMNEKQAYIVNCFYIANENRIYIPLAYLQKPFVDLGDRGIEYNLAQVGYALGHEMSHSLDTTGSKYDYKGNLKSWWTPGDRKIFNQKVADVIKQYKQFAAYDNIEFDVSMTTGEDMADISGFAICLEYLRDYNDFHNVLIPLRSASFHKFFAQIAVQGKQRVMSKALKSQLAINPHPLEVYRVNCVLARSLLFSEMYNIKKTDKMYWKNKDTIW